MALNVLFASTLTRMHSVHSFKLCHARVEHTYSLKVNTPRSPAGYYTYIYITTRTCENTALRRRYEGLPGWRRMNVIGQTAELLRLGLMFPIYCLAYMLCPHSGRGVFMKNPFVKFIAHSASYMCFLTLLAAASQRVERVTLALIGRLVISMQHFIDKNS